MHGMTDLVQAVPLGLPQPPACIEGVVLEKEPDLVTGLDEVVVALVQIPGARENRADLRRIEALDERQCPLLQCSTSFARDEIAQNQESVVLVGGNHFGRQPPADRPDPRLAKSDWRPSPLTNVLQAEDVERVIAAIDVLPPRQREALDMRLLHEMSYSDIAEELGCHEQNVRQAVSRGLHKLARILGR